ncbi:MFS transporter, LPLT family, lysophospholipid transporter [Gammaproteobacteria bacterium]
MNSNFLKLLVAQFLSAFADNAILFTAVAMAMQAGVHPSYLSALQGMFLVAFVILAPWVGAFSDSRPKSIALSIANFVKATGTGLLWVGIDPLVSYAVVGVGAAMYNPSKYGILPELVGHDDLVQANGWIEGVTLTAILSGSLTGGWVADRSIPMAVVLFGSLFLLAGISARFITPIPPKTKEDSPPHFIKIVKELLKKPRARICILGIALFWATIMALRVMLVAWAPAVLNVHESVKIAELTSFSAIGVAIGAILAFRVISLDRLPRVRFAAFSLGSMLFLFGTVGDVGTARGILFLVGLSGGLFAVPINAAIQEIGHQSVGSGNTIAIQQFFESLGMMASTAVYALAVAHSVDPVLAFYVLGGLVLVATLFVSMRLPG